MQASTANVLHPRQVVDLNESKAQLRKILDGPAYIREQLQDNGALVTKQIGDIDRMLKQAPEPIPAGEIDEAVRLETQLRTEWLDGMPTAAEMRRNPPGAVDKNMAWQNKRKPTVLAWKQLRRRLHASGISSHKLADEGDISNIEMYRPVGGGQEMSMDNAQIAGTDFHLPPPEADPVTVLTMERETALRSVDPDLLDKIGLLDNEQRAKVFSIIDTIIAADQVDESEQPPKPKPQPRDRGNYKHSELAYLRAEAKKYGINSFGKSKVDLKALVAERQGG